MAATAAVLVCDAATAALYGELTPIRRNADGEILESRYDIRSCQARGRLLRGTIWGGPKGAVQLHGFSRSTASGRFLARAIFGLGLKAALRAQGTPIPENDLWIAALVRQHGLTLVSRDEHFDAVPGLAIERWED